jgi:hypothetical protein
MPIPAVTLAAVLLAAAGATPRAYVVTAASALDAARASETVEVGLASLPGLGADDLPRLVVVDTATGRELLAQAVDSDGDADFDLLVFQADFAPRATRTFRLAVGERRPYRRDDFRVYGRFVRERFDDFAWENDRLAHRMYGAALETWRKEPLTSSGVDVWFKRTRRLVINDWYMVDDYHRDHGEGADLYSAGPTRGCGGSAVWAEGRLHVSRNFRGSRVLANGPLRLIFELSYEPWTAGGRRVSETKRITLDAGSSLNRFESRYTAEGGGPIAVAAGIKKAKGAEVRAEAAAGWLRTWEPVREGREGNYGCGVLFDPAAVAELAEADGNVLLVARPLDGARVAYHAGFAWDRGPDFSTMAEWDRYLEHAAARLRSPLRVEVKAE